MTTPYNVQLPPMPPMASPTAPSFRKRQFRFSVRNDIDLLKLVLRHNPYGAPHGGRLHKWQNIANTLRESGIDIDFRRARDRTALLLEQWRQKDIETLRRCSSANHEDHAQKFSLLEQINEIELAAKPRDIEFRRATMRRPPVSQPSLNPVHIPDDQHQNSNLPHHDRKYSPYPSPAQTQSLPHSHPGHLPPLNHEPNVMQPRPADDVSLFVSQPTKMIRANSGKRLAAPSPFSPNIFPHSSLPSSSAEHRARSQDIGYPDLGVFRSSPFRTAQPAMNNPLDASTAATALGSLPMPTSPRTQEPPLALDHNVVVSSAAGNAAATVPPLSHPAPAGVERYVPMADFRVHMQRIESILDQHLMYFKQSIAKDEKRRQEEKERLDRFFEMINQDREERRIRDERDREERQKIMSFLLRHHGNEPEHNG